MKDIVHIGLISLAIFLMLIAGYKILDIPSKRDFHNGLICWLFVSALMIWQVVF